MDHSAMLVSQKWMSICQRHQKKMGASFSILYRKQTSEFKNTERTCWCTCKLSIVYKVLEHVAKENILQGIKVAKHRIK